MRSEENQGPPRNTTESQRPWADMGAPCHSDTIVVDPVHTGMNLATCTLSAHSGTKLRAWQVGYMLGISWVPLGQNNNNKYCVTSGRSEGVPQRAQLCRCRYRPARPRQILDKATFCLGLGWWYGDTTHEPSTSALGPNKRKTNGAPARPAGRMVGRSGGRNFVW